MSENVLGNLVFVVNRFQLFASIFTKKLEWIQTKARGIFYRRKGKEQRYLSYIELLIFRWALIM